MAGSFQDAFIDAGVISQADLDRKEAEKKEQERKERERKLAKLQVEEMAREDAHNRAREAKRAREKRESDEHQKKIKIFDDMWHNPKSRNFMVHIVHAFTPIEKGHFAWTPEEMPNPSCCICKCKLASKNDMLKKVPEIAEMPLKHISESVKGTLTEEKLAADFSKVTEGRVLGIVSEDSKLAFCGECYRNYSSWMEFAILRGYSHIHRIINKKRQEKKEELVKNEKNGL
jgi:hypothetical protein